MALWIARALLSFALGMAVFLALVVFLIISGLRGTLTAGPYLGALDQANAYERVYSQVLTTDFVNSIRLELADPLAPLTSEEILQLIQTVAPPAYLRSQVEENLALLDRYFSGDDQTLELYVNLAAPMDRMGPAVAGVVEPRISGARWRSANMTREQAPKSNPNLAKGPAEDVQDKSSDQYAAEVEQAMASLLTGNPVLSSISDLTDIHREEALAIFDRTMENILANPEIGQDYRDSLAGARPALRDAFAGGDTSGLLSAAMDASLGLAIDRALAETRSRLDDEGKFDLVSLLAEDLLGVEESQLQASLGEYRDGVRSFLFWGTAIPAFTVLLALTLASALFWWKVDAILRWLYVTLLLAGASAFATVLASYLLLPATVETAAYEVLSATPDLPPGLASLASEVARSFLASQLRDLIWIAGLPIIAGSAIWAAVRAFPALRPKGQTSKPGSEQNPNAD